MRHLREFMAFVPEDQVCVFVLEDGNEIIVDGLKNYREVWKGSEFDDYLVANYKNRTTRRPRGIPMTKKNLQLLIYIVKGE